MDKLSGFEFEYLENKNSLDIILELIKKKKMNILDLNILDLTNQFLIYLESVKNEISLEECSDYTRMASYLIELKTRSLLPDSDLNLKYKNTLEEEQQAFIKRLLEYQIYKKSVPLLLEKQKRRSFLLDKSPEDFDDYAQSELPLGKLPKHMDVNKLAEIFENVIRKQAIKNQIKQPIDLHVSSQEYSVESVIKDIIIKLKSYSNVIISIEELFELADEKQRNIEYYWMMFFAILYFVHKEYMILEIGESIDNFKISINERRLNLESNSDNLLSDLIDELVD